MRHLLRRSWRSHQLFLAMAAVTVSSFLAFTYLGSWPTNAVGGSLAAAIAYAWYLWELRQHDMGSRAEPESRLWRLVGVTAIMWSFAWLYQAGVVVIAGELPAIPSLADLIRLAGYLAAIVALMRDPFPTGPRGSRVRDLLDSVVIGLGSLVLFWLAVIEPALDVGFASQVTVAWMGIAPALDLVLVALSLRLILLAQRRPIRRLLALLALAFASRLPSNLAIGYAFVQSGSSVGSLADLGWLLSPLALVVSLRYRQSLPDPVGAFDRYRGDSLSHRTGILLPFAVVGLVAGFTLISFWLVGELSLLGSIAAGGLALLLVARQGVLAGQSELRQYTSLVEGAADLAFVCDARGKLLLTNPALEAAVGRGEGSAPPEQLAAFMEGPLAAKSLLQEALEDGWAGEVEFRSSDGRTFPVALSLQAVMDERRSERVIAGTAHDLTELKQRERALREALEEVAEARRELEVLNRSLEAKVENRTQELANTVERLERLNEELQELDRLKSEFVTLVSHELRGPLTNIRSGVELTLNRSASLPTSVEETLKLVLSETERLGTFVEIILDLSALEAGRFPLAEEDVPLVEAARAVVARIPEGRGRGRIDLQIPGHLPRIEGDEGAVISVLFHLLDNALKYAPSGAVTVSAEEQDGGLRVAVEDQGPGIPAKERDAVFDRFHRLDASDAREVYGHGLGLHLSRRLVEAMGGTIRAKEAASGGARFEFWLPLAARTREGG